MYNKLYLANIKIYLVFLFKTGRSCNLHYNKGTAKKYNVFLTTCGRACGRSVCGWEVSNRPATSRHINCTAFLSLCYRDDILKPFFEELTDIDRRNGYFQQDSATAHTANDTLELLGEIF